MVFSLFAIVTGERPLLRTCCPLVMFAGLFAAAYANALAARPASDCPAGTVPWPAETEACEAVGSARDSAKTFLRSNIFPFDKANEATLFDGGLVGPTVDLSLTARQRFGWAARVPRDVWQDAVLPYASVNEARTDWRQLLWAQLFPLVANVSNASTLKDVALLVNQKMWAGLGHFSGTKSITFRSQQTPLIFDPMSTLLYGYASCTGISLLYVDALRALGVPARLVGTPAWQGKLEDGNHNWVEVWLGEGEQGTDTGDAWAFIEGAPAGGGETFTNACDKWFCSQKYFTASPNRTRVFATSYDRASATTYYPMAWDPNNTAVVGVDRADVYFAACARCGVARARRL